MNIPPREWLDFLRQQYPPGSRIKLTQMGSDPQPIPPGSEGTLVRIDDAGQFQIDWDNGRSLALIMGEDRFTVSPPEPTLLKLYMPLTADFYPRNEWGDISEDGEPWDGRTLADYEDSVLAALVRKRMPEERERGLMHYLYLLGKVQQRQYPPRMTPHLRQEVMKFEQYKEQFAFLREQGITTPEQLAAFQTRTEETLATLTKRRTLLNVRKKRRRELYSALADETALAPAKECFEMGLFGMEEELARYQTAKEMLDQCPIPRERLTKEKSALYQQLAEVNREIRAARKQLSLCKEIQKNSPQMEQDIQTVENKTKEVKRDERGRQ